MKASNPSTWQMSGLEKDYFLSGWLIPITLAHEHYQPTKPLDIVSCRFLIIATYKRNFIYHIYIKFSGGSSQTLHCEGKLFTLWLVGPRMPYHWVTEFFSWTWLPGCSGSSQNCLMVNWLTFSAVLIFFGLDQCCHQGCHPTDQCCASNQWPSTSRLSSIVMWVSH